jgi:hypothetical protein
MKCFSKACGIQFKIKGLKNSLNFFIFSQGDGANRLLAVSYPKGSLRNFSA